MSETYYCTESVMEEV